MKCNKCKEKYPASINEHAPGGSNSPGVFFVFNILSILAGFIFVALLWETGVIITTIALILGLVANIIVYIGFLLSNGLRGVSCPKCDQKNWVYPWSL
jgi:hypothetical protein